MSRPVPAATAGLRVLRQLAAQPGPVTATSLAAAVGLARSSAYHLLHAMQREGFVVHYVEEQRWGLGIAAFEVGSGYGRHQPLQRLARLPLTALVDRTGQSAHLAVLHGAEVLYVVEERAPGRPPLVTDVGVRLPAHLTASGRAILATLPAAQVRAVFPDRDAFVDRHGTGPRTLSALRALLVDTRRRGYAVENGEVTPGFASVAVAIPARTVPMLAAVALTYPASEDIELGRPSGRRTVAAVAATAREIGRRLGGGS